VIPAGQPSYLLFGSGLHEALQLFFRKRYQEKDITTGKEYMLRAYEYFMDRHKHHFTPKELTDHITYGKMVLDQYFNFYSPKWSEDVKYEPEYKIRDIQIAGVPVSGFIDRIDRREHSIIVYDYKSGKTDNLGPKTKAPDEKVPNGGDYWRQMVFYDLMLAQDPRIKSHIDHGYIQGLEPKKDGTFVERKVVVTDQDRETVIAQITDTYQKIQNMEFDKGCGKCAWCEMHGITPSLPGDEDETVH
jgi:DNA helicase-2/ATP-dependent DNA helicase PcrA